MSLLATVLPWAMAIVVLAMALNTWRLMKGPALVDRILAGEQALDILCVEGAILRGPGGSGRFQMLAGTGRPTWLRRCSTAACQAGCRSRSARVRCWCLPLR